MKKYFGLSILMLLLVGLLSGSVFAATTGQLNAGNTTIAAEKVPAAGLAIPAVNTGYEVGGPIAATSQIKISLTNGTFGATVVNICDNAGNAYGGAIPVAGSTSVTITTILPMTTGNVYNFQPAACAAGPVALTQINIAASQVAGSVVSMTVDDALNPGNTLVYATAPIVTLINQLSINVFSPVTDTISFANAMKTFAGGVLTSTAKVALLSNETIANKIASGHAGSNTTCAAWPATAESLKFTVTPGSGSTMGSGFNTTTAFQAGRTASLFIVDATIASTDASASGTATINGNMAAFSCGAGSSATTMGTAGNYIEQVLTVNGTTVLTARSYKLAAETNGGGAIVAGARSILDATTAWTWSLDSSQYYVPLVASNVSAGRETYIKLQSKNTSTGANGVSIAILDNTGGITATWTGQIVAGTPLTVSGADLVAAATAAGKTVDGAAGFGVIITVNAPVSDVFAYANMTESTGNTKVVPVKAVYTAAAAAATPYIIE